MSAPLRVGTRGSELALWQARHVSALLAHTATAVAELVIVHTSGDKDRSRSLHELPGSGFFTKELQRTLLDGGVDLVVHSLKDLPIEEPDGLALAAVLDRADVRDLLLALPEATGDGPLGLRPGARLGTSSLRRSAQALAAQPDVRVVPLRGNVPTRIERLREGRFDAILLASAGVDRLGIDLEGLVARRLALDLFLPAPGQGALAIEIRSDDAATRAAVSRLDDPAVAQATRCERAVLKGLGGGCHLPLGTHAARNGSGFDLRASWGELDQEVTRATVKRVRVHGGTPEQAAANALAALREGAGA